jgi:RNA polymerase sigma-70 factor (ECF subfamily)
LKFVTSSGKNLAPAASSEKESDSTAQTTASTQTDGESCHAVNVSSTELKEAAKRLFQYMLKNSSAQEADDLSQQVWMDYLSAARREPVRSQMALLNWITKCVLAKFYARKRSDREKLMPLDSVGPEDAHQMGAEMTDVHNLKRDLNWALSKLPPKHREVLCCVALEGKSWQETATELRLSPSTVKKYSTQARAMVKKLLEQVFCRATVPPGDNR